MWGQLILKYYSHSGRKLQACIALHFVLTYAVSILHFRAYVVCRLNFSNTTDVCSALVMCNLHVTYMLSIRVAC